MIRQATEAGAGPGRDRGVLSLPDRQALLRVQAGKMPNRRAIRRLSMSRLIQVNAKAHIRLTRAGLEALFACGDASLDAVS